jgi:hypothetical protein
MAASLFACAYNEEHYNEEQRRCGRRWIHLWGCMADRPHAAPALLRDQAEGPGPKI